MKFADNILGYGNKRFIEVYFRGFKNDTFGYSSAQPAKKVSVFAQGSGRLSLLQPNQDTTKVSIKKTLVTIFLDDVDADTALDYEDEDLATAYWDRESQEVITKAQMNDIVEIDDSVDESDISSVTAQ
jgi:hypothetical protein